MTEARTHDPHRPRLPSATESSAQQAAYLREEVARLRRERAAEQPTAGREENAAKLGDALAAREAELRSVYASRSWRVTRPLRALSRAITALHAPNVLGRWRSHLRAPPSLAESEGATGSVGVVPLNVPSAKRVLLAGPPPDEPITQARVEIILGALSGSADHRSIVHNTTTASLPPPEYVGESAALTWWTPEDTIAIDEDLRWAFVRGLEAAEVLLPILRARCPWARLIVDIDDAISSNPDVAAKLVFYDLALVPGRVAKEVILAREPLAAVDIIPEPTTVFADVPVCDDSQKCIIAILHDDSKRLDLETRGLLETVVPTIKRLRRNAKFRVIYATEDIPEVSHADIQLVANAAGTSMPFSDVAMCLVPAASSEWAVRRIVAAALGQGVPLITSEVAAADFGLRSGGEILVAESNWAFADRAAWLLDDGEMRQRIRAAGHAFARERLSTTAIRMLAKRLLRG